MENWNLRISVSISLGLHLLLIFTASLLFSDTKVRQTAIRQVKVILHTLEEEKKSFPKSVSPLSAKDPIKRSVKGQSIQEQKERESDRKKEKELEPPIPLPVMAVARDIPLEEPKVIFPREKEKMVYPVTNSNGGLNAAGIILRSNPTAAQEGVIFNGVKEPTNVAEDAAWEKPFNLKEKEALSVSALPEVLQGNKISGNGPREGAGNGQPGSLEEGSGNGSGAGRGGFRWRVSGEGTGLGQGGSGGGGSGNGSGPGTGSGQGGPSGGGPHIGTGVLGKLFPSSGGVAGGYPRYGENSKPSYPEEARRKGMEGEVLLKVEVLANGGVGQIEVKRSSGHEILDRSALSAVKQWRFIPANKENGPIPCWVNIPIKFQLQ